MIRITVFGNGYGESIVLELPGERFGLIDCFASNTPKKKNPSLDYLQKKSVSELLFICWTHPHKDHSSGIADIMREFKGRIKYFWKFDGLSLRFLQAYYQKYLNKNKKNEILMQIEKRRSNYLNEVFNEYLEFIQSIKEQKDRYKKVSCGKTLFVDKQNKIQILGVSPVDWYIQDYEKKALMGITEKGTANILHLQSHNKVSAAIMINYGEAKILMGADTENETWEIIERDIANDLCKHLFHFIKVPHHGSENAIYELLWKKWSMNNEPYSVITSLKNNRQILPRKSAIKKLNNYTSRIWIIGSNRNEYASTKKNIDIDLIYPLETNMAKGTKMIEFDIFQDGSVKRIQSNKES